MVGLLFLLPDYLADGIATRPTRLARLVVPKAAIDG
jgi:hypothetical protein